ncbi:ATP-binding protein, partial [uncultured Mailhella sp.]|uniref:ATP-binding protein n=1 Tax=uncultured Mailhella sp. TaxID=1981031 RepID=UPI00260A8E37
QEVHAANQLIGNAASQHVRSPLLVQTQNILLENGNVVIALTVPAGMDKPYFDRKGVIWLKAGADKRRINSKEELRRFFQYTSQFHADELPTKAGIDKLDKLLFRDFLKKRYDSDFPDTHAEQLRLLQNLNLAAGDGTLNLAGVLLFAEQPELIFPQFVAKGVRFPGIAVHADRYDDTEDFEGPLSRLFKDALAFVMRNLYKVQADNGVNAPGTPEIPERVFEELLVNALVHRDYLVSAPIRIFIFDDRVEIVSPGTLPNNLTIANIKNGNSNIRNPILVSYAAKGLLPYHGIGSGIQRALEAWPDIDFEDDREGTLFKAIVRRRHQSSESTEVFAPETAPETQDLHQKPSSSGANAQAFAPEIAPEIAPELLELLKRLAANPRITIAELADVLKVSRRTVLTRINTLKTKGLLRRIGPNKGGQWELIP